MFAWRCMLVIGFMSPGKYSLWQPGIRIIPSDAEVTRIGVNPIFKD